MTKHAHKRVTLEPSDEQKLRLELAQLKCHSNIEVRWRLEAEHQLYESQALLYQLAMEVAKERKTQIEGQLAQAEREAKNLTQVLVNIGEQIKLENGWADQVQWDPLNLTFTAPADEIPAVAMTESSEAKIRIQ